MIHPSFSELYLLKLAVARYLGLNVLDIARIDIAVQLTGKVDAVNVNLSMRPAEPPDTLP